jgi:hypothetical protein
MNIEKLYYEIQKIKQDLEDGIITKKDAINFIINFGLTKEQAKVVLK